MKHFTHSREGFAWLESLTNLARKPDPSMRAYRLDRMRMLLEKTDQPQRQFKTIHIAGSKGKGSTAAFSASILTTAGYRTGLYLSPHVSSYKERITLNGAFFPEEIYLEGLNTLWDLVRGLETLLPGNEQPTTFELLTLLGFLIFARTGCDWVVLETGLGGRLDATNVVLPEVSVLTHIEKEHSAILGDTLEKIAAEKAGIIKPKTPVVFGEHPPEVEGVFRRIAEEREAPVVKPDPTRPYRVVYLPKEVPEKAFFLDMEGQKASLKLRGTSSAENAALAVTAVKRVLPDIEEKSILRGIEETFLPARTELLEYRGTRFLLDGAHTPGSLRALLCTWKRLFPDGGLLLFGCTTDKDAEGMAEVAALEMQEIVITTPGSFKPSIPAETTRIFQQKNPSTRLIPDPDQALQSILKEKTSAVLVCGSFFLCGEIRKHLLEEPESS